MSRRAWLPYPARTIGRRPPCPTGLPRFTTLDHAHRALHYGLGAPSLETWWCQQCDGAHLSDTSTARNPT